MTQMIRTPYRRPRESGGPGATARRLPWVPAFAGMTDNHLILTASFQTRYLHLKSSSWWDNRSRPSPGRRPTHLFVAPAKAGARSK